MASTQKAVQDTVPTAELASFIADMEFDDIPEEGVRLAERCFVDTVAVTLPGAMEGAGATAARTTKTAGTAGPARLFCHDSDATLPDAAFVNATAGHGLDFDDVGDGMSGHPSVTMVAPILALGEAENASGEEMLAAFVAGFETQCYVAGPILPEHYEAGWHATATFGTFGAAAAIAHLLGADEEQTRNALNIAASMPAGLKRNFGTMTKPMHAGNAARSGVTAALLAVEEFTADPNAIGGDRGFYDLYGQTEPDFDELFELGERWAIVEDGVNIKKFPCCYFTHSSIEAAARLAEEHDIRAADVESIHVVSSRGAKDTLNHEQADTGLQGKFSMHYTVGSAIARDRVGLSAFDDENVDHPDVQAVSEKVTFEADESLPYGSHRTTVTIETTDGGRHELTLEEPPGTHDDPLSEAELEEKFEMCAARALDDDAAANLYAELNDLRAVEDAADLVADL